MFKNNIFEQIADEYLKFCLTVYLKYYTFMTQVSEKLKVE